MTSFGPVTGNVIGDVQFKDGSVSFSQAVGGANTPGKIYYVDRNISVSGDGKSWGKAFKTFQEAITQVNSDYTNTVAPSNGRNRWIFVGEGWYAETPSTLTANDVTIVGVAPGSHDSVVIYGVPVAGTFSGVAGGPTLQLTCSNCTIMNMGFYCSDVLYAAVQDGGAAADTHLSAVANSYNNKFINCSFVRDTADGELGGIDVASNEGPIIENCRFSTSCKTFGVRIRTNGVTNPVGVQIKDCKFVGTETGIIKSAGSDCVVEHCLFIDDTTDRADTITTPVTSEGNQLILIDNYWEFSDANAITGAGDHLNINNNTLAKT